MNGEVASLHAIPALLVLIALSLPLLSFITSFIIPASHAWLSSLCSTLILLASAVLAFIAAWMFKGTSPVVYEITWFHLGDYAVQAGGALQYETVNLFASITVVSFLIHAYSVGYMARDEKIRPYFAFLGLFTFAMLGLILASDLLFLFVFWEIVGFCSFLLIGHWNHKPEAGRAAVKAFIFNRVGDAGLLLGLMLIWVNTGTLQVSEIAALPASGSWQMVASLLVFCGVIGKSAQLPLYTWLPDAMAGPTPVSALIHAATMVAAGVFLLARLAFLFPPESFAVVVIVGSLTALFGALFALGENNLKRILAYSTISQLGLMVAGIGAGAGDASMAHLLTHAFFKAGLFLCAGSIIYAMEQAHPQKSKHVEWDIRELGGLRRRIPVTFVSFAICGASLAGLPFFSGFLSKEAIMDGVFTWSEGASWRIVIPVILLASSMITVFYMFRLFVCVFFGNAGEDQTAVRESPPIMRIPVALLAVLSLFPMVLLNPYLGDPGLPVVPGLTGYLPLILNLAALALAWMAFGTGKNRQPLHLNGTQTLSALPDRFYQYVIVLPVASLSRMLEALDRKVIDAILHSTAAFSVTTAHIIAWLDKILIDTLIVTGISSATRGAGAITRSVHSGRIQRYIFWSVLGMVLFAIIVLI